MKPRAARAPIDLDKLFYGPFTEAEITALKGESFQLVGLEGLELTKATVVNNFLIVKMAPPAPPRRKAKR